MEYLGKSPHLGSYIKLDDISGSFDSTEVTFNLTSGGKPYYTTNPYTLFLVLGGVLQEPIISFTINQDQITFASAPTTSTPCYIVVLGNTFHTGGLRTLPIVLKNGTDVKNVPITTTTIPVSTRDGSYVPVMINAG